MPRPEFKDRQVVDRMLETYLQLMARTMALESEPKEFDTGTKLHRVEIHTIQAIGRRPGLNLLSLATDMKVTKGAASQMVTKLVKKGLVAKERAAGNAKEISLDLTPLGWRGYHAHERFHDHLYDVFRDHFGEALESKMDQFGSVLGELLEITDLYEKRVKDF